MKQYKWNTIKIQLLRLIISTPYRSNFMTILDILQLLKKPAVVCGSCYWRFGCIWKTKTSWSSVIWGQAFIKLIQHFKLSSTVHCILFVKLIFKLFIHYWKLWFGSLGLRWSYSPRWTSEPSFWCGWTLLPPYREDWCRVTWCCWLVFNRHYGCSQLHLLSKTIM